MNKIQGYDEAQAYTGESRALPAGKYICEIKGAKEVETKTVRNSWYCNWILQRANTRIFIATNFQKLLKKRERRQSGTTEDFSDKDTRVNNYRF